MTSGGGVEFGFEEGVYNDVLTASSFFCKKFVKLLNIDYDNNDNNDNNNPIDNNNYFKYEF